VLFCGSAIEDKTERPPFYTIEVVKAESQAVLNPFTERDFQDALKGQRRWKLCIHAYFFEGDSGQ
jgi:hypothetical protein